MAISGVDKLFKRIGRMQRDLKDTQRALRASGVLMLGSVEKNFKAQGRPEKWKSLAPATVARRRTGKGKGSAQILIDTARLKNSPDIQVNDDSVEIGTNTIYAKRQHFGYEGKEGKRGHSKTPARPFLMFQEEDIRDIGEIFKRHIK